MSFNFDPAYLALLKSNRELRKELNSEASINQSNEKKICILIKELEQWNRTISFQDTTIIAHEKEIQELKSQVSDLEKRLRIALKDVDKKEGYILDLEQWLSTLEEEVIVLKKKIRELTFWKYNKSVEIKDSLNIVKMANQIQPPRPNELNNLFDTLLDENVHIDDYIRNSHTSAWNQRDILNKIITVNDSALRLKEIADWENDKPSI